MKLTEGFPIQGVPHVNATLFGGPYRLYVPGQRRLVGVKMAEEIDNTHDVSIPTEDFSVPDVQVLTQGIIDTMMLMHAGNDVYVGCMGGTGRTGLFMSCFVKAMDAISNDGKQSPGFDPVKYVRQKYRPHAVETKQQEQFVKDFDTAPIVAAYHELILAPLTVPVIHEVEKIVEKRVEVPVEVIKEVPVYLTPWQWLLDVLAAFWASLTGKPKA